MAMTRLINNYTVDNGVGYIHIINRKGEEFEIITDADTIDRLITEDINLSINSNGYAQLKSKGMKAPKLLHRWILGVTKREEHVDHINANKHDCRKVNMRVTDAKGNANNPNNKPLGEIPIRGLSILKDGREKKYRFRRTGDKPQYFYTIDDAKEYIRQNYPREMIS